MADQVERVGVGLVGGFGQVVEVDAPLFEPLDDVATFFWVCPFVAQFRRIAVERADLVGRVVGELDDAKLVAVGVKLVNQVGSDLDPPAVEVKLAARAIGLVRGQFFRAVAFLRFGLRRNDCLFAGRFPFLVDDHFGFDGGVSIEIGIGKQPRGRAGVVEDAEKQLAVVVSDAGSAADDLLELGHRVDDPHQHDVLDRGGIDAGGEQLRRSEDDRRAAFQVLKVAEVAASEVAFVGRDAADVVGIVADEIGV